MEFSHGRRKSGGLSNLNRYPNQQPQESLIFG